MSLLVILVDMTSA